MWTPSHNGDARVGSSGRRCKGWSPKDSYLRGRERKATTTGGQGQSERGRRRTRETSILTDRLVYGTSVGSGARLKSWLCHLLIDRPRGSLFMTPCLSFPICKTGSRLQTHPFIIVGFAARARTLQITYISALPPGPC